MADKISPLDAVMKTGHHGKPVISDEQVVLKVSHRTCPSLIQITSWPDTDKNIASSLKELTGLKLSGGNASPGNDNIAIIPIGPGRYLIASDEPNIVERFREKIPVAKGAVTDLSHGRVTIRISGDQATWVLAKGIAIDFSIVAFPVETSRNSSHHDIGLTIRRIDENTFDLFVFTSLARSFWHWLDIAAKEVGYEIIRVIK